MELLSCPGLKVALALVVTPLVIRRYLRRPGMYRSIVTLPAIGVAAGEVIGATLAVPVADDVKLRYPPVARLPFDTLSTSVTFKEPPKVTPALLLMVIPATMFEEKLDAGIVCGDEPFISIVPLLVEKVPLLIMLPAICRVAPVIVSEAPAEMVISLIAAVPVLRTG